MEESQVQQVEKNLTELAKETTCSAEFIAMFASRNLLEPSQVANLKSSDWTPMEKSKNLYEILVKQQGSFEVLLQSLEMTRQTNALKILLDGGGIFRNYGTISYKKNKVIRTGSYIGNKIYQGRFGGRNVAVKVMNADIAETRLAYKEVDMLKKLDNHENIVRYFTVEEGEGFIQIVLERFENTLQDEIKFNLNAVNVNSVSILRECTMAVVFLHSMSVIHTDLNPANILLKKNGQAKICNFGLAQQIGTGMQSASVYLENVRNKDWMAPELLRHFVEDETDSHIIEVSTACDVFSLGCIFFFVLMKGVHPFGNPVLRQSNIYYDKPQLQNSSLDPNWLQLIKNMISHSSSDRPSAIETLLDGCFTTTETYTSSSPQKEMPTSPDHGVSMEPPVSLTDVLPAEIAPDLDTTNSTNIPLIQIFEEISETVTNTKRHSTSKRNGNNRSPCSSSRAKKQKMSLQAQTEKSLASSIKVEQQDHFDELGNNAIFRAVIKRKRLRELKRIVDNGSDVKIFNNAGDSILHLAVHHKDSQVVKFLISAGADVNAKSSSGDLPIHKLKGTKHSFKEKLVALCENGVDMNAEDAGGNTLLHLAASAGRSKNDIEFIISKSGNWKRKNKAGQTVLHFAVEGGNPDVIKLLIKMGIKIHVKGSNGEMPIHRIRFTKQNFNKTLGSLLGYGASINATDKDGDTVLGLAAWAGRSKSDLEHIISKGGNVEAKNINGHSILHWAARGGDPEAIKFLIELGANVNLKDNFEEVPLHQIVLTKNDFIGSLDVLLENGADLNEQNEFGNSLLHLSILHGRPKSDLEYIVARGGNWKLKNRRWESVLHFAAQGGNLEAIQYFITLGIQISIEDNIQRLPIHDVVENKSNFRETVEVLLEHGASINAIDKYGDNLLNLAALQGRSTEIFEYIIQKGGNWKMKNNNGQTILHLSAVDGNVEAIKYFMQLGCKVHARDKDGSVPLHFLAYAKKNFKECLDVFLEHEAKINAKNKQRETLLDLAVTEKREDEVLEYIVSKGGSGKMYDRLFV